MPDHDFTTGPWRRDKYKVEKSDSTPLDPRAAYVVLRIDSDPLARRAVRLYAWLLAWVNPRAADELLLYLDETAIADGQVPERLTRAASGVITFQSEMGGSPITSTTI